MGKWRKLKPKPSTPYQRKPAKAKQTKAIKIGMLLDGDADHFSREYTDKGYKGGSSAAIELQKRVEKYFRSEKNIAKGTRIDILAYSFANFWGLSRFLNVNVRTFAEDFNSSPFAFKMSDAGSAPEAADEALESHLPSLISSCDFVIFGGSHDNGYHDLLASHKGTDLFGKLLLLRTGSRVGKSIVRLGLEEVWFEGLFHNHGSDEESEESGSDLSDSDESDSDSEDSDSEDSDSEDSDSEDSDSGDSQSDSSEENESLAKINNYGYPDSSSHSTAPSLSPSPSLSSSLSSNPSTFSLIDDNTIPDEFFSLVSALRRCPCPVSFSVVASRMINDGNKTWSSQQRAFTRLVESAAQADILSISRNMASTNESSIRLATCYWLTNRPVPSEFAPLLEAIMRFDENGPRCTVIAALLHKDTRTPLKGRRWKGYLAEAVELGLVETGTRGMGNEWVEIADGLWV